VRSPRRLLALVALAGSLLGAPGCLVLSMSSFYQDTQITFDDRLVGTWIDNDDHVTAVLERGPWRSYRVTYTHPTEKGVLTGYLFRRGDARYLDLVPVSGVDPGSFLLPSHALLKISIDDDTHATAAPLSFDWFDRAFRAHALPSSVDATRGQHFQVVIGGDPAATRTWIFTAPHWGEPVSFQKQ
jgi:hypothetical protein